MKIEAKPQDILIQSGRNRARLVIMSSNLKDVWIWNHTEAASPRQIFRGDLRQVETQNFLKSWSMA